MELVLLCEVGEKAEQAIAILSKCEFPSGLFAGGQMEEVEKSELYFKNTVYHKLYLKFSESS